MPWQWSSAVAHVKANGKEKAFDAFNNAPQFKDRDLYGFVFDLDSLVLAHGTNNRLIGKNLAEVKDVDGKPFVKKFLEQAKVKGSGWTDYTWLNPTTKGIEQKSGYVKKAHDIAIGAGIYKDK